MLKVPSALQAKFEASLLQKAVPQSALGSHLKWLRFYWIFAEVSLS